MYLLSVCRSELMTARLLYTLVNHDAATIALKCAMEALAARHQNAGSIDLHTGDALKCVMHEFTGALLHSAGYNRNSAVDRSGFTWAVPQMWEHIGNTNARVFHLIVSKCWADALGAMMESCTFHFNCLQQIEQLSTAAQGREVVCFDLPNRVCACRRVCGSQCRRRCMDLSAAEKKLFGLLLPYFFLLLFLAGFTSTIVVVANQVGFQMSGAQERMNPQLLNDFHHRRTHNLREMSSAAVFGALRAMFLSCLHHSTLGHNFKLLREWPSGAFPLQPSRWTNAPHWILLSAFSMPENALKALALLHSALGLRALTRAVEEEYRAALLAARNQNDLTRQQRLLATPSNWRNMHGGVYGNEYAAQSARGGFARGSSSIRKFVIQAPGPDFFMVLGRECRDWSDGPLYLKVNLKVVGMAPLRNLIATTLDITITPTVLKSLKIPMDPSTLANAHARSIAGQLVERDWRISPSMLWDENADRQLCWDADEAMDRFDVRVSETREDRDGVTGGPLPIGELEWEYEHVPSTTGETSAASALEAGQYRAAAESGAQSALMEPWLMAYGRFTRSVCCFPYGPPINEDATPEPNNVLNSWEVWSSTEFFHNYIRVRDALMSYDAPS
jgi:hypothetical protein